MYAVLGSVGCGGSIRDPGPPAAGPDRAEIERLHQADVAATRTADPAQLTALWDPDGAFFEQGEPPVIGERALRAMYERNQTKVLSYEPHLRDPQISGQLATEWGTYDASFQEPDHARATPVHGRYLRVMKRQPDGTWRFLRIMLQDDKP
jgi:ketosteroid isomerase-like protein